VSVGGLIISWFVGIKLPGLEYNNQKVEAAFRKELVYAEDYKIIYGKTETLVELFTSLKFNYNRLFMHYGYFDVWVNFFEQLMVIVPYLIMGPGLFTGLITLGVLVQVSNAFSKVRESFSIFISNWTTITELRSIHKRLKEFEININY
jgi:peptide/bleomycin uptake transporter